MSTHARQHKFVDSKVQGRLVGLFVRCWAMSLVTAGILTVLGWMFITPGLGGFIGPNEFMSSILPMVLVGAVASLLVMPFMLWKMVCDTNRFAGPLLRFRRHLREAADSGELVPIEFRDEDDWHDLANAFNDLVSRINSERLADTMSPEFREQLDRSIADSIHPQSEAELSDEHSDELVVGA
ncbi:hypothetical protein [Aeoliella mucimassa]|uniref:HAMP domain-containing protein n=1 Tax=Aeoliella mucimassa TaxID=2527972 RepID=A0A518ANJ7_9BACT|nr:hypothetical protein [Aeoliella mucimassa]QDU56294.1 hypothetical protein Pan181_25030 [Aeoliella mucimassa]